MLPRGAGSGRHNIMTRRGIILGAFSRAVLPQSQQEYVCPMDPEVRAAKPGRCPRCGMSLVTGLPGPLEYPVDVRMVPAAPRAGQQVQLSFTVRHPKTGARVRDFEVVHEKLHHLFVVSQDLNYFRHEHPQLGRDGVFRVEMELPAPGMYRLLSDFYPRHGTPQLVESTVILPGGAITGGTRLAADLEPKRGVSLEMKPARPIAGLKTLMFFRIDPSDGLEPYLGAWAHMLTVSEDLVDMIHDHPFLAGGGPQIQFNMIFPRAVPYRLWVQFQRRGVVHTVQFDVPVGVLR
jgi:hypothetical protein